MGGIIRLFNVPNERRQLANEARAHREQADIALEQMADEQDDAVFQASSIREQARREAEAIIMQTDAAVQSAQFESRQLAKNADLATVDANINERALRRQGARETSTQVAAIAGSGFELGDFEDIIRTSAEESLQDALLVRRDGVMKHLDLAASSAFRAAEAGDIAEAGLIEQNTVLDTGEKKAKAAEFAGRGRAREMRAEAIKAQSGAKSAQVRRGRVLVNAFAAVADDAAKVAKFA